MALRIRNNKDIKGFQIKIDEQTHSINISQLADDTTLYFNSNNDISVAMNEIEIFGTFSGLMYLRSLLVCLSI
jgi:rRNA processing protein Krr1/Pno1